MQFAIESLPQAADRGALDRLLEARGGMPWDLLPGGTAEETRKMLVQQAQYWQAEAAKHVEARAQARQLAQIQLALQHQHQQLQPPRPQQQQQMQSPRQQQPSPQQQRQFGGGVPSSPQVGNLAGAYAAGVQVSGPMQWSNSGGVTITNVNIIPPAPLPSPRAVLPPPSPAPHFRHHPAAQAAGQPGSGLKVPWQNALLHATQVPPKAPAPSWQTGGANSGAITHSTYSWTCTDVESESTSSESSGSKRRRLESEEDGTSICEGASAAAVMGPPSWQVSMPYPAAPQPPPASRPPPNLPTFKASPYPSALGPPKTPSPRAQAPTADVGAVKLGMQRGPATESHQSITERQRREKIAERMKTLQDLVPNSNKPDQASMLEEIIDYVKFLQLQVKILSVNRGSEMPSPTQPYGLPSAALSSSTPASFSTLMERANVEREVSQLMETEMGSAMRYLLSKGLCLVPLNVASQLTDRPERNDSSPDGGFARGDTTCGSVIAGTAWEPWKDDS